MNTDLRRRALHVGALAQGVAKPVADGVLDAQRGELEALERALLRGEIDAQAALHVEELRPVERFRSCINILLIAIRERIDFPKNARRDARPQVGSITDVPTARKGDSPGDNRRLRSAQRLELLGKKLFEAA